MTDQEMTLGLAVASDTPPERIASVARRAEAAGFAELWIPEDPYFLGSVAAVVGALAATRRIVVGQGVVSALSRHPAVLAMEAATAERMFPGRVRVGVGLGLPEVLAQLGVTPKSQLSAVRETVTNVRALLSGKTAQHAGQVFTLDGVRLEHAPEHVPQIYTGAVGPKMLQLSGEIADGTLMSALAGTTYVSWARERIREGHARAGIVGKPHPVSTLALYAVDTDGRRAKDLIRPMLAFYLSVAPTLALIQVYGITDQLLDMCERGGSNAAELIQREMPDEWIDDLVIAGDPDECVERIERLRAAGAGSVVLMPFPSASFESCMELTERYVLPKLGIDQTS
ncbi:LLM class flavin-dependent oxidoreductase [Microbispora sp. NEAU-D428]|uniref:LLM class flavin-dependent oxidoreductase n=1 Tax=Microbispora sitophila TaxID=2771537 RepID=UPI0018672293|nr:LLM class flavin-dependent oxidoreductase [Microbispora sitophila]MBE3016047.1 LLM class flavin-dependent oxidoreductase [Microbispora sitophila]